MWSISVLGLHTIQKCHTKIQSREYCNIWKKIRKNREFTFDTHGEEILLIKCYVDTDFVGLYNIENNVDSVSSKSRTGFIIFIDKCLVIWQRKLQRETVLFTTESEIMIMSIVMRELLWLKQLTINIVSILRIELKHNIVITNKIFENNNGAIVLIIKSGSTSRTKYIYTKYWFFKEYIGAYKSIVLRKIETENQIIGIFIKRVEKALYILLRNRLIDWKD